MKKILVFMLVISTLLVCSGFATAIGVNSFPNDELFQMELKSPAKKMSRPSMF